MSMQNQHDGHVGISTTNGAHEHGRGKPSAFAGAGNRRFGDFVFGILELHDDGQAKLGARRIWCFEQPFVNRVLGKTFSGEFA